MKRRTALKLMGVSIAVPLLAVKASPETVQVPEDWMLWQWVIMKTSAEDLGMVNCEPCSEVLTLDHDLAKPIGKVFHVYQKGEQIRAHLEIFDPDVLKWVRDKTSADPAALSWQVSTEEAEWNCPDWPRGPTLRTVMRSRLLALAIVQESKVRPDGQTWLVR